MTEKAFLTINEAAKAAGLSPSVLRIWEVRYAWPAPKRQPNGYRVYTRHQVDELKRIAELVRAGTPISSLIIDGLPRWPANPQVHAGPVQLTAARSLVDAHDRDALELIEALETRRPHRAVELLQRSIWSLRPRDEVQRILVPALVGLAEWRAAGRPLKDADSFDDLIRERGLQLLKRQPTDANARWVVPANDESHTLAVVTAIVLCLRGQPARYWYGDDLPTDNAKVVVVGDGDCTICSQLGALVPPLSTLPSGDRPSFLSLAAA